MEFINYLSEYLFKQQYTFRNINCDLYLSLFDQLLNDRQPKRPFLWPWPSQGAQISQGLGQAQRT